MQKNETTNVAHENSEIKVCAAKIVPGKEGLILGDGIVINLRNHLRENETIKIVATSFGKEEIKAGAKKAIRKHLEQNPTNEKMEEKSGDGR